MNLDKLYAYWPTVWFVDFASESFDWYQGSAVYYLDKTCVHNMSRFHRNNVIKVHLIDLNLTYYWSCLRKHINRTTCEPKIWKLRKASICIFTAVVAIFEHWPLNIEVLLVQSLQTCKIQFVVIWKCKSITHCLDNKLCYIKNFITSIRKEALM